MKKGDYLAAVLRSKQTVFTLKDIILLWGESAFSSARVRVNYYSPVKTKLRVLEIG